MKTINRILEQIPVELNTDQAHRIAIALLILVGFYILGELVRKCIFPFLERMAQKSGSDYDDKLLEAFCRPIEWLIIISGLYLALRYLPLNAATDMVILNLFRSAILVLIAWGLYALTGTDSPLSLELQRKFNVDRIIIAFFSKAIRFAILSLTVVVIAQEWGYDVNGFIAGLGLGGLALALAAKDALANIFGGIVIILEKPFVSGDWITTGTADGVVESTTFRTTRIRGFDDSLILVPNATLANESIVNNTRRGKRLVSFYLRLAYDTTRSQIDQCVGGIKAMLESHPGVHPQTIMVFFEEFSDSSLDIKVYFYSVTTVWAEHLAVRQDVNLKIMGILEDAEVNLALPARNLYIQKPDTNSPSKAPLS